MKSIIKSKIFYLLILLMSVSAILYVLNLKELYWFEGDIARDTLKALQILRNRQITMIGPPLSFGQYGTREIYFGSLVYYFGVIGLWLFGENALGPVYVQSALMVVSIPFFYLLTRYFFRNKKIRILVTLFYALNPITVLHSRFYWNPNFIIPLAVWFWLLIFKGISSQRNLIYLFGAGIVGGLIINLHYTVALPIGLVVLYLLIKRRTRELAIYFLGLFFALLPLLLFEIKNNFYLIQAFLFNLQKIQNTTYQPGLHNLNRIFELGSVIPILIGLRQEFPFDIRYIVLPESLIMFLGFLSLGVYSFLLLKSKLSNGKMVPFVVLSSIIASVLLSKENYSIRYMYAVYPLLLITLLLVIKNISDKWKMTTYVFYLITLMSLISTFKIVTKQTIITISKYRMPSIEDLEYAAKIIKNDYNGRSFNITENITGDSRATYLRYFVYRDVSNDKLRGVEDYGGLETLYVITPSQKLTEAENRWEFNATYNLKLAKSWDIKEYKLLRYDVQK